MADYQQAILEARNLVDVVLEAEHDNERKQGLLAMRPALYGDGDLAWVQWRGESGTAANRPAD